MLENDLAYVTDIIDTKVILRLQFCRAFNLVQSNSDDQCECKKVAVDIINSKFPRGFDPGNNPVSTKLQQPPVDINLKLRPDCKAQIMELFPNLFEGVGTIQSAKVWLDADPSVPPLVEPPRKIPQVMVDQLKQEID